MEKGIILSLIAGLTTLSGIIFTFKINNKNRVDALIKICLTITFITLIYISLFDLTKEAIKNLNNKPFLVILIYILINYTIINIILRISSKNKKFQSKEGELKKIGIINAITLLLHNIPEGVITYITSSYNYKLGLKISLSIIMHNIPEGISIAVPTYYGTNSRKKTFKLLFISAIAEPFGALLSCIFLNKYINNTLIGYILLTVAIIMISISIEEIFPKVREGGVDKYTLIGLIISTLFIFLMKIMN